MFAFPADSFHHFRWTESLCFSLFPLACSMVFFLFFLPLPAFGFFRFLFFFIYKPSSTFPSSLRRWIIPFFFPLLPSSFYICHPSPFVSSPLLLAGEGLTLFSSLVVEKPLLSLLPRRGLFIVFLVLTERLEFLSSL